MLKDKRKQTELPWKTEPDRVKPQIYITGERPDGEGRPGVVPRKDKLRIRL